MRNIVKFPRSMMSIIRSLGVAMSTEDGKKQYMYFPFWIEKDVKTGELRLYSYDELPNEIKQCLTEMREEVYENK